VIARHVLVKLTLVKEPLVALVAAVGIVTLVRTDMIVHGIDFGFGGIAIGANVLANIISLIAPARGHGNKQCVQSKGWGDFKFFARAFGLERYCLLNTIAVVDARFAARGG
jgi:hypothetical protein